MPRFDQSFNGLCEQNHQDTQVLKQRYLEPKAKRPNKPKDKKQQDTISSSVHVQQKFLKRSAEEHDPGGGGGPGGGVPNGDASFEPPVKLQCTTQQHGTQEQDGLTKFSVQIVQRVEFTTSAANSQPQQISTNVTVKAHTNASVKSDVASPKPSQQNQNAQNANQSKGGNGGGGVNTSNDSGMPDCVKQEPLNDFADLDECAAAVEKDAANGGMGFGNITDLIGDENNDELFTSPAFKAIIKDIAANFNEFNFDFDDKSDDLKVQDSKDLLSSISSSDLKSTPIGGASGNAGGGNFQSANQNCSPPVFENKRMPPYMSGDFVKTELSPAAQTLKQMAEQHQHQKQMGLSFNPPSRAPPGVANARSPYSDFPMNEYGSPNPNQNQNQSSGAGAGGGGNFHKNSPGFQQSVQGVEMIKQEMIYQGNEFDMKRKAAAAGIYKQQYSPYGSPSPGSHGSPGYLPRNNQPGGGTGAGPNGGGFAGATPPRPPSGPGGNNGTTTLQINQAQSMHISQQSHGHNIQVSAGQHLHLSGDLKGNVSIATQQGVHFQQQQQQQATPHPNAPNAQTQPNNHTSHNSHQNDSSGVPQQGPTSGGPNSNNPNMMNVNESMHAQNGPGSGPNQGPGSGPNQGMHGGNGGMSMNNMNMNNMSGMNNMNNMNMNAMNPNMGNMGNNVMMNAGHGPGGPGGPGQMNDSYSMTQSQTINFTQQTLRQRGSGIPPGMGMPTQMGAGGPGGPMAPNGMRHMTPMEQQKLMQQQQIIRAQQQAAMQQQQQQQQHMVRPPPPEYKASAGLMQGMGGPRYGPGPGPVPGAGPGNMPPGGMRRMPHQSMPPSGPMMRPHSMYMMQQQQQQQMAARGMYPPRQQGPMGGNPGAGNGGMDGGPGGPQHGSAEWRHMMMQQGNNFGNQMRPNFAQHQGANKPGFNMNAANPMQMQMAQPQMRGMNQPMMGQQGPGGGAPSQGGGPMAQMTSMNQQMMMQQQQNVVQGNNQMSMTNIHMQQTQSLSINSQSHHQQQQQQNQQQQQPQQNNQLSSTANNQNNDFLDLLAFQPDSTLSDQELLKFANEAGFNFNDINI